MNDVDAMQRHRDLIRAAIHHHEMFFQTDSKQSALGKQSAVTFERVRPQLEVSITRVHDRMVHAIRSNDAEIIGQDAVTTLVKRSSERRFARARPACKRYRAPAN